MGTKISSTLSALSHLIFTACLQWLKPGCSGKPLQRQQPHAGRWKKEGSFSSSGASLQVSHAVTAWMNTASATGSLSPHKRPSIAHSDHTCLSSLNFDTESFSLTQRKADQKDIDVVSQPCAIWLNPHLLCSFATPFLKAVSLTQLFHIELGNSFGDSGKQ